MKPIIFSTPMAQAILGGRKTMTRRVMKPQPKIITADTARRCPLAFWGDGRWFKPKYQPGEILWVRETWRPAVDGETGIRLGSYFYKADGGSGAAFKDPYNPWRPSIHMPKEAARIFLRVTDVRAERLQEITEEDATYEGCVDTRGFIWSPDNEYNNPHSAREAFKRLWDSLNAKRGYGWEKNPWVWVIAFERCGRCEG